MSLPPDDLFAFLGATVERLDQVGIPYMITGSLALAVYATPRMTRDIDLVIEASATQVDALIAVIESDCYVSRDAAQEAVRTGGMFNAVELSSTFKVDFILRRDEPYEREKFSRRRAILLDGRPVLIIAPEDLILSKLVWGRDSGSARQLDDVRSLQAITPELDRPYLERWGASLGVLPTLRELRLA